MVFLSDDLLARREENGRRQLAVKGTEHEIDFASVAKLYTPLADAIWLNAGVAELQPASRKGFRGHHRERQSTAHDRKHQAYDTQAGKKMINLLDNESVRRS